MFAHTKHRASTSLILGAVVVMCLPVVALAAGTPDAAAASGDVRRSTISQVPEGGRGGALADSRDDEYAPLVTGGNRVSPSAKSSQGKPGSGDARTFAVNQDFWFYDVDVQLYGDNDGDGYFRGIDLLFDADTYFDVADVYAVAYLSFEGGPWNEYATTDVFTLYGATSDDEFVIVSDLSSGYPRGDYDLLIELYDTFDGAYVASIGPEDTSELGYLPLEDADRDVPRQRGGGGAVDPAWLAALLCLLVLRAAAVIRPRRARAGHDGRSA